MPNKVSCRLKTRPRIACVVSRMLVLVLAVFAVYAGFLGLRDAQPVWSARQTLAADDPATYLLRNGLFDEDEGWLTYAVDVASDVAAIDVLTAYVDPFSLHIEARIDGRLVFELADSSTRGQLTCTRVALPAGEADRTVELRIQGNGITGTSAVFLAADDASDVVLGAGDAVRLFEMGLLCAMVFYGVTLYWFKRTEGYALRFAVYSALLLMQAVVFASQGQLPGTAHLFVAIRTCVLVATALLSVGIGYRLMGVEVPHWMRPVFEGHTVFGIAVLSGIAAYCVWGLNSLYVQIPVNVAAIAGAAYGCAKAPHGKFYIGAILLLSMLACSNGSLLRPLDLAQSFVYDFVFTMPLFNMPFVLVFMLAVNRMFAEKFAEAEELNALLDAKVAARTSELENQTAQKRQLMVNVFHDLRSPLFVVRGAAEIVQECPQRALELAPIIRERADFMAELTDDLFFMAKLEDEQVVFADDAVDVCRVLHAVVDAYAFEARERGVTIECRCECACLVQADGQKLKRALGNLVSNAVRFSPRDGLVVLEAASEGGDTVVIRIVDQGCGMTPEEMSLAFEQYYRRDRSPESKSTGLGLSIAQGIVHRMGGTIGIDSQQGIGTIFIVTLCAAPDPDGLDGGGDSALV